SFSSLGDLIWLSESPLFQCHYSEAPRNRPQTACP
ncbi:hypothetical protein VCHC64A1_03704B, partial [Vibrio cholerae HC-64A1]